MGRSYVPVFYDWIEVTEELKDDEKGRLIDAVILYARGEDYKPRMTGNERFLFPAYKQLIDRNAEISEVRAKAGATRKENKAEQTETKPIKAEQKRFTAPTIDEVRAYCKERNNSVNAGRFVDFYASKGWKVGNQPMKDWKAAVRTWERERRAPTKTVTATQYEQRDYSGAQEEAMRRFIEQNAV